MAVIGGNPAFLQKNKGYATKSENRQIEREFSVIFLDSRSGRPAAENSVTPDGEVATLEKTGRRADENGRTKTAAMHLTNGVHEDMGGKKDIPVQDIEGVDASQSVQVGAFAMFSQTIIGEGPEVLQVLNPVAVPQGEGLELAPRLVTLDGRRVAFFWNSKPGGDLALQRIEEQLLARYPTMVAKQLHWEHHKGGGVIPLKEIMPFKPDAVIVSTADCAVSVGSSADLVALERLGIPTVIVTAAHFLHSVQDQAKFSGLVQDLPVAIVPDPLTNVTPAKIIQHVDEIIDDIVDGLLIGKYVQQEVKTTCAKQNSNVVEYRGSTYSALFDLMNKSFLEHGIGDGLPIIPPTYDRVSAMLAATQEPADTEVASLGLGNGAGTIEKIAINAVMAGCEPPHFPVVLAAVRAIAHPGFPLRGLAGSTTAHSTMLIINGPIAKKLGINSGVCCLGPGAISHVNIVIGRAIRLIQMNIAFQYPGITDLDYLGAGNKFSLCFAECEEANPWDPLHVEHGFSRDISTVSAIAVDSQSEGRSASPKPELILRALAAAIATPTTTGSTIWMDTDEVSNSPVVILSSTHAKALAEAGWTKHNIKQFLYHHSRVPAFFYKYCSSRNGGQLNHAWQWLNDASDDTLVPIATSPDAFQIVVVNGEGPKSATFTAIPGIVTVAV